jgi:hypothetical protein
MTAAGEPRRLGLEVRFDAEPIQGRLYDQRDRGRLNRPFSSAIDAARGADPSPPSEEGEAQ